MANYDRKARTALLALAELVEELPPSIMVQKARVKRDAFLKAIEELKPKPKSAS